ncbi:RES family NAD+ phosphorylase [Rathayibacter sp. AY1D9]|uniref:RES family NAD+ phosphorylase n=1 Tax=Rathayibacter sp. AY1D9 TaxID=2080548 RepID=UPI001C683980|nr:RES family NAD+ phosphorylase [Rathayibacter sp. AY1D9]
MNLRDNVLVDLVVGTGTCGYCRTPGAALVRPTELREAFEVLVGVYEVVDNGLSLPEILRQDWALFNHPVMQDDAHAKELLADVLDSGDLFRKAFGPPAGYGTQSLTKWDDLRAEMMHGNRWFLSKDIDYDRLRYLFSLLIEDPSVLSERWHRARIMNDETLYTLEEMGAPPPRYAGHGRANPAGIPYLYLGSSPSTSISEVRPHTAEAASVAEFSIPELKAVDLRSPRERISPFGLEDDQVVQLLADIPFLERLGDELTRPVLPKSAPFEYVPSQHLCEFIKHCGYDGVIYRSSVSEGINIALFHPEVARGGAVQRYTVKQVEVHVELAT